MYKSVGFALDFNVLEKILVYLKFGPDAIERKKNRRSYNWRVSERLDLTHFYC